MVHRCEMRTNAQECIPVGCVPPSHWSYLRISSYPMHHSWATMHAPPGATTHAPPRATMHAPPQEQPHMPPWEQPCMPPWEQPHPPEQPCTPPQEQPRTPPGSNHVSPQEQPCTPPGATTHAPPVNRMTNRCKNITLLQTSFAGGKQACFRERTEMRTNTPAFIAGKPLFQISDRKFLLQNM